MSAMIEIDIVAHFRAKSDRSSKCLNSSARIDRKECRPVGQAHSVNEAGSRVLVANAEVIESNFTDDEDAEGPGAGLELRAEKPMQSSEVRVHQLGGHAIGERIGKAPLEVVSHFRFQLDAGMKVER